MINLNQQSAGWNVSQPRHLIACVTYIHPYIQSDVTLNWSECCLLWSISGSIWIWKTGHTWSNRLYKAGVTPTVNLSKIANSTGRSDVCTLSYMSRNSPEGVKLKHPELIAAGLPVAARDNIILSVLNDSLHTSCLFVSQKSNRYNAQCSVLLWGTICWRTADFSRHHFVLFILRAITAVP